MLLCDGKVGNSYILESMELPESLSKRLEALGMTVGTSISVLNSKGQGILIIKIRGTRFALGKNISRNIKVREPHEG